MSSSNAVITNTASAYFHGWDIARCRQQLAIAQQSLNTLPNTLSKMQYDQMTCMLNTRIRVVQTIIALHSLSNIMGRESFARLAKSMKLTQLPNTMKDFMRRAQIWERHIRENRPTGQQRSLCEGLARNLFFTRLLKRMFKHDADTWLEALQQEHPNIGWLNKMKAPKSKLAKAA